jgi:hypothetical protein
MCLPPKPDQPTSTSAGETRAIVGIGALMIMACLAGPALAALAGGAILALALCFAVPSVGLLWRRRGSSPAPAPEADDLSARA